MIDMMSGKYKLTLIELLGEGSFGRVYRCQLIDIINKTIILCAVKIEKKGRSKAEIESKALTEIRRSYKDSVPKIYEKIYTKTDSLLFMEFLQTSIDAIIKKDKIKYLENIELYRTWWLSMLRCIKNVHNCKYIHRDVKPSNFMISKSNKVKIIDFGLSKKYITSDGKHILENNRKPIGTMRYMSVNVHNGKEPSRRDDLISLLYIIIQHILTKLPWENMKISSKTTNSSQIYTEKMQAIKQRKEEYDYENNLPANICVCYKYLLNLAFDEDPNYEYIETLIKY